MTLVAVVATVVALVTAASGLGLTLASRARASGILLVLASAAAVLGIVLRGADDGDAGRVAVVAATFLLVPAAVLAYPDWAWRRPVEFITTTTTLAAGLIAVLFSRDAGVLESMGLIIVLTLAGHLWWRIETATGDTREAVQWLTVTAGVAGLTMGMVVFATEGATGQGPAVAVTLLCLCLPIGPAMALGVLRPHVLDVRGVVNWGVVIAVTVIVYLSVFAGIVGWIDAAGGDPSPGTLGLIGAVLALGFHPTLVLLRGVIDRLLFGDRPDPVRAATQVVDRIGDDPMLALRAIREALVLPYASLRADGRTLATSGTEVTHTRTLPLQLGGDEVGEIVVGLRAGDLSLAQSDAEVLRIVAPLLAQTLRAQALARDLQASRNAVISAIEEERRRLRRDLHDGLGPTLTGVAFATDAARNQLVTDPAAADALLARLRADTTAAIGEVRRLVEGLRPPALDELGLIGAVRQHAATLLSCGGEQLRVSISAPQPLPHLSAAAEVTAYRIVVEALTNVARHAAATSAEVELRVVGTDLCLSVSDDGAAGRAWVPGVGTSSMRERAEQIGGSLTTASDPSGGRVEALIPLARQDAP